MITLCMNDSAISLIYIILFGSLVVVYFLLILVIKSYTNFLVKGNVFLRYILLIPISILILIMILFVLYQINKDAFLN